VFTSFGDFFLFVRLARPADPTLARARWAQRWARRYLRVLGIEVARTGLLPPVGMLVSNHLGYIDILVLSAAQPLVFVAKSELRVWPLIGWMTRCAGTVFVRRAHPRDVRRVVGEFPRVVAAGVVVAFFPEGTSSDGRTVLPFHPSLFAPAGRQGWPVTPAWIEYAVDADDGDATREVCWWGDADFAGHFWNLLSKRRIRARIRYGAPQPPGSEPKALARSLHAQICALGGVTPGPDDLAARAELAAGRSPAGW
jgi:1-acyl-sn-glycerol-3-phosphate acyltransferase